MNAPRIEVDGWCYKDAPLDGGDSRKLVTLEQDGMVWVGIRVWQSTGKRWVNNGEPIKIERVKCWRDMPSPGRCFWDRGILTDPYPAQSQAQGEPEKGK